MAGLPEITHMAVFCHLLEDAKKRKLLIVERDEKSGQYAIRLPQDD